MLYFSALFSVWFFLFARRRNRVERPEQGSCVSDRIVGRSTGHIKHTDLKELSAPQNKKTGLADTEDPPLALFVQANNGPTTMAAFFSTMYHTSL